MDAVFDALASAVSGLLAVDERRLADAELQAAVVATARERARMSVVSARLVAEWDRRGLGTADGSNTAAERLARDTLTSIPSAQLELQRAHRAARMPLTTQAVAEGTLSPDHIDVLGRACTAERADAFARDEASLVKECQRNRFTVAARKVDYWRKRVDAELGARERRAERRSRLYTSRTLPGTVHVDGWFNPVDGAIVTGELKRLEKELRRSDRRTGLTRTAAERRAAAMVEMATRSATMPAGGRRPRPLFTVHLGDPSFSELCELAAGTVMTPGGLVPWLTNADMETVLFDTPYTVISMSRRRAVLGTLRRAVEVRDRHCQHAAGCDEPAEHCDIDHVVPVTSGGVTSQFNLRALCAGPNRDPRRRDQFPVPYPERVVDFVEHLRARLRAQVLRERWEDPADGDGVVDWTGWFDDEPGAEPGGPGEPNGPSEPGEPNGPSRPSSPSGRGGSGEPNGPGGPDPPDP